MNNPSDSETVPNALDRRREFRLNRFLGAELILDDQRRKTRFYIINISRTGLKATNQFALDEADIHEFDLYLYPKQPPINLTAMLAWQKPLIASGTFELGFEFVSMTDENADVIEKFIESERNKPAPPRPSEPLKLWGYEC